MCDAPALPARDDDDALIDEARHGRLLPGAGALPLARLMARLPPSTPISLEIQSDRLEATMPPRERAAEALRAALELIERMR